MTRARATSPRREPNPLAATLAPVETALPAAPSDPKPTPTFLPNPAAAWRVLRAHWIEQRGEVPARTLRDATFPATTVADVVAITNHVTAALRNDVARVNPVLGRRVWDRWRQSVAQIRKRVARARDDAAPYADNETFWEDALLYIVFAMPAKPRNAAPATDGDDDRPSSSSATSPRYAGHGVPEPRESNRARAWLGAIPQPPTLLPEPNVAVTNLRAAFEASFRPGAVDWMDGRANVLVNYVTLALRNDLVALDAHDAAVIWMRWRDAIVDFVAHRAADYEVALRYRLDALAADLASARARPRSVYDSFCPWRAQYFDSDRLHPEAIGHNPRRSPLEIHSWRS